MDLSIVIPAYNEEKRLGGSLSKIIPYLDSLELNYEIIVVDDGSKDKTIEVANQFKDKTNLRVLENKINRGKGYSVKQGILDAKFDHVLFTDSDLATPIDELDILLEGLKEDNDIVIASRTLEDSEIIVNQPFYRQIMGKTFPLMVRVIAVRGISETQCGFKLFKTEVIQNIVKHQTIDRFGFDVELLFLAKKMNYKIKEVPVQWIDQEGSRLHPIKDGYGMFKELLKVRSNHFLGKYKINQA